MKVNSLLMILICFSMYQKSVESQVVQNQITPDLKKDIEEINLVRKRSKLLSCMSIVRNSLAEGNSDLKETLDNSNLDRGKAFDKIVVTMILNCEKRISEAEIEQTLMPENILTPITSNQTLAKLITFDRHLLSPSSSSASATDTLNLSEEEMNLLKGMSETSQMDSDFTMQEEEIGFMGFKLSQIGSSAYIFIFIALIIFAVIILGGFYLLKCKKKESKRDRKKKHS